MKKLLYSFILLFTFTQAQAQTADDRAKAVYQEALKEFESKNYQQTLDYCKQVTDILKTTHSRIEILRIKSYFELGEYDKVKTSIATITKLSASTELKNEALEYLVKVENIEKAAEEKRLAEKRRLERENLEREQRLEQERKAKEQAENKSYADAMSGNIKAIRQFLKNYPNHPEKQSVLILLDVKDEQTYNAAIAKNTFKDYEDYLKLFYDGKHTAEISEELNKAKENQAFELAVRTNLVNDFETYLNTYLNGNYKTDILPLYEQALNIEGHQAMLQKDYLKAEELYRKYKTLFPNGEHIKTVENQYNNVQRKLEKQERIASRTDKTYFMLNYATNESAGMEIGKINKSYKLSVYGALNYGFRFPIEENEVIELESIEDYEGDGNLKAGLVTGSFGFNMKITYPLWIYAGGGVRYQVYVDGSSTSYKIKGEDYWQFFPEFGLRTKLGKAITLKAGVQLFEDKPAFQFGIGF